MKMIPINQFPEPNENDSYLYYQCHSLKAVMRGGFQTTVYLTSSFPSITYDNTLSTNKYSLLYRLIILSEHIDISPARPQNVHITGFSPYPRPSIGETYTHFPL